MENQSPPKRVTRARAAAKTNATEPTLRIATAASKAKIARATSASTVGRKPRTEPAEPNNEKHITDETMKQEEKPKATRGRPKKAAATETQVQAQAEAPKEGLTKAPVRSVRGRPRKVVVEEPLAVEPARSTRGRTRKVAMDEGTGEQQLEPTKKATRGRVAPMSKSTAAPKKAVKFEDTQPEKENIVPVGKGKAKEEPAIGIRAKPVRKAALPARVTRGRAKPTEKAQDKSPLSPKKITQMPFSRDSTSEDELATMEKTPLKPLMKSPIRDATIVTGHGKKLDLTTSITANRLVLDSAQDFGSTLMGSPARRLPQSPFKDAMKASPRRVPGDAMLKPAFKLSFAATGSTGSDASPAKASLLQSPAKRPLKQIKVNEPGSPTMKPVVQGSFLNSPAKRPVSPTKINADGSPTRVGSSVFTLGTTPKPSTFSISRFTTPRTLQKNAFRSGRTECSTSKPVTEVKTPAEDLEKVDNTLIMPFPGRLSAVLPRHADPAFPDEHCLISEVSENDMPSTEKPIKGDRAVDSLDVTVMNVGEYQPSAVQVSDTRSTTPTSSPPRNSVGNFALRDQDDDPFLGSDSEDELASSLPQYSPAPLSSFKISAVDFGAPATPTPSMLGNTTPKAGQYETAINGFAKTGSGSRSSREKREKIGFTPLARQLSEWMAASPSKSSSSSSSDDSDGEQQQSPTQAAMEDILVASPAGSVPTSAIKSTFFDDEMSIRDEMAEASDPNFMDAIEFAPSEMDEEDLALVEEADELSLLDPDAFIQSDLPTSEQVRDEAGSLSELDQYDGGLSTASDEPSLIAVDEINSAEIGDESTSTIDTAALSEASQEYGDENALPIEPAARIEAINVIRPTLPAMDAPTLQGPAPLSERRFATPRRVMGERAFHTVSKVPLKPPGDESPRQAAMTQVSNTVSRLPTQKGVPLLIDGKTPTKQTRSVSTPTHSPGWSVAGTPVRTPRPDLNNQVLKGAVVFVDVHTAEGADASAIFIELLGWMGAKCVKTWNWNPSSSSPVENLGSGGTGSGTKVGITHVVFKDGGKRTIEKVRESNGVVLCVGVGWVLE